MNLKEKKENGWEVGLVRIVKDILRVNAAVLTLKQRQNTAGTWLTLNINKDVTMRSRTQATAEILGFGRQICVVGCPDSFREHQIPL